MSWEFLGVVVLFLLLLVFSYFTETIMARLDCPAVPLRKRVKLRFCDLCKERGPWETRRMHYYSAKYVHVNSDITNYQVNVCPQCLLDFRKRLRGLQRM